MQINEKDIVWDNEIDKSVIQKIPAINESEIVWDKLPQVNETNNQNPFIQQGKEGYNNQVHNMDMNAVNSTPITSNEQKSFLDTVKDFGFNILNGFKKGADATAEPIVNAIQKSQDTLIKPIADNPVVRAVEDTANFLTPVGEFDFASQYNKKDDFVAKAIKEQDLPIEAYNDINKLANTDMTLFANAKDGKDTYNENLAKIVIDKFGFDDLGIGEDGKYYATKGNETIQLNKDSLAEFTSSLYGDKMEILGSILGAKAGFDVGKNFGTKGKLVGGLAGGAIGAGAGNIVDMLDSIITNGEKLNTTQILDEVSKSAALDAGAGLVTAGIIKGGGALIDLNPWNVEKKAQAYVDNVLKTSDNTDIENKILENAQAFGGKNNQELTKLATFDETQKSLSDLYDNSVEARNTVRADNEALTTNLFNKLNIDEIKTDSIANTNEKIAGNISGEVSGIENYWNDLYTQTKDDIVKIAGNENIPLKPTTVDSVNKNIKSLEVVDNVQKKNIEPDKLNEFQKDYASMLDAIQINLKQEIPTPDGGVIKEDVNSYTLTGMMDLQKKFNDFFYKHEDKLTGQQKKNLGDIKTSIYNDIENYIGYKFDGDAQTAKQIKDKWTEVNSDLGNWKKTKGRQKILQDIIDSKVDVNQLTSKFISDAGNIDKDGFDMLGNIGYQLSKSNPEKLDEFYGSIVNNMLESTKIKETVNQQDIRYLDFEKFNKVYDDLRGQTLNKTFGRTERGKEILNTLDTFRELAKNEEKIQNAVLKNQTPLSESGRTSKENTRDFLFGIPYAIRHRLLNVFSKRMFKSDAFHFIVTDMAKNRRYSIKEFDDSISKIKIRNEKLPVNKKFSQDEIDELIEVRKEIEAFKTQRENEFNAIKEIVKDIDSLEEKRLIQKQFLEESKKEAQMLEQKIKANMLLEHKAIIPPAQITEGAKEPLPLDVQDRISVANTKQPSIEPVGQAKPTSFDEFTTKMGIDKNKIISDVETKKQFEELMKSPYFDEVVFNGQNTYAKDSKYAFSKDGQDKYVPENFAGQGNENGYNKINASYTNNDKFGTVFTKQDYNNLQKGNITEEMVNKLKLEIGEREQADLLAKEQFNKEFEEADKAGNIPFSNPVVGGASVGAASGTQTDFNQDGKVDEVDVVIGTLIGSIGIKKTMDLFPQYFKK